MPRLCSLPLCAVLRADGNRAVPALAVSHTLLTARTCAGCLVVANYALLTVSCLSLGGSVIRIINAYIGL